MPIDRKTKAISEVQYTQMQMCSLPTSASCFSVSSGSLPSQFRSVTPKPEVRVTMEKCEQKTSTCCSTRTVYVILIAVFLISSSIAVTIAVSEIKRVQNASRTLQGGIVIHTKEKDPTTTTTTHAPVKNVTKPYKPQHKTAAQMPFDDDYEARPRCANNCSMYGKPQFRSRCQDGFCLCEGNDYQRETCLPEVSGCRITKHPKSQYIALWGKPSTIYMCQNNKLSPNEDFYVIGIYGNHFADATVVNVVGKNDVPVRIALASHYPVRWKLSVSDVQVRDVILTSENKLSTSQLEFVSGMEHAVPTVHEITQPVGYGDDRYHSDTAEMLRKLTNTYGPIKSFTGASFADKITIDIS